MHNLWVRVVDQSNAMEVPEKTVRHVYEIRRVKLSDSCDNDTSDGVNPETQTVVAEEAQKEDFRLDELRFQSRLI